MKYVPKLNFKGTTPGNKYVYKTEDMVSIKDHSLEFAEI
jgi:hypothetical protein